MKVVLAFVLVLLAAVTALAYGQAAGGAGLAGLTSLTGGVVPPWTEPAALLLSGGALLGIAGAVRRLPF